MRDARHGIYFRVSHLEDDPDPSDAAIREMLAGNLCRCTGYHFIVEAVRALARSRGAR